jgi:hypothetical protein
MSMQGAVNGHAAQYPFCCFSFGLLEFFMGVVSFLFHASKLRLFAIVDITFIFGIKTAIIVANLARANAWGDFACGACILIPAAIIPAVDPLRVGLRNLLKDRAVNLLSIEYEMEILIVLTVLLIATLTLHPPKFSTFLLFVSAYVPKVVEISNVFPIPPLSIFQPTALHHFLMAATIWSFTMDWCNLDHSQTPDPHE